MILDQVLAAQSTLSDSQVIRVMVSGQTRELGINKSALVRLYERNNPGQFREVVSSKDGLYSFKGCGKGKPYFLIAFDRTKQFNAVIQDNIVPK